MDARKPDSSGQKGVNTRKNMSTSKCVTTLMLGQQMGEIDHAYMKYKAALQTVISKIDCCNINGCRGIPAKTKMTVCPTDVEQVTQVEVSPDGMYLLFTTSNNCLFVLDLWKAGKSESEIVVSSKIEGKPVEFFKTMSKNDESKGLQDATRVIRGGAVSLPGDEFLRRGISCLEMSPSGKKILTTGRDSSALTILEVDPSKEKGHPEQFDRAWAEFDENKVWSGMGLLTKSAECYRGIGKITGGTWFGENMVMVVDNNGLMKVCTLHDEKAEVTTKNRIHIPTHALPGDDEHAFPRCETMSTLVGIDQVPIRNEFIVTSSCGEIYILQLDEHLGVTARGAKRIGIPRSELNWDSQRRETLVLSQAVDPNTATVIIGTIDGLTIMDTRVPYSPEYVKLYDTTKPKRVSLREADMGKPVSISVENNLVYAGLYGGYICFYDLRAGNWIHEERGIEPSARLAWRLGVKDQYDDHQPPGCPSRFTPFPEFSFPLISLKKKNGVLAVGGGPVYNDDAVARRLEGAVTVWT